MKRSLIPEFEALLKELPTGMGYHVAALETTDAEAHAKKVKTIWWDWRDRMELFVRKIDREIRPELKKARQQKHHEARKPKDISSAVSSPPGEDVQRTGEVTDEEEQ